MLLKDFLSNINMDEQLDEQILETSQNDENLDDDYNDINNFGGGLSNNLLMISELLFAGTVVLQQLFCAYYK